MHLRHDLRPVFRMDRTARRHCVQLLLEREVARGSGRRQVMAARSIGTLTISFGLVAIPVKLYSATEASARNLVQPPAQDLRLAPAPAVLLHQGRSAGLARRNGQGLRVRQGPVRDVLAGRIEGDGRSRHADRRHQRVRADLGDRSGLLRQGLLPRARQGRRQTLCAVHQGAARIQALRASAAGPRAASSTS